MVPIARRARIFSHGVLTRYPYQANLHGLPPEVIKECLLGVIEAKLRGDGDGDGRAGELRGLLPAPLRRRHLEALHDPVQREDLGRAAARDHRRPGARGSCRCRTWSRWSRARSGAGPPEMGYNQSFLYPKSGGIETFTRALQTRLARRRACTRAPAPTPSTGAGARSTVGGERIRVPRAGRDHPAARAAQAHARPAARDRSARRRACAARRCATSTSARAASRPPTGTGSTCPRSGIRSIA